jgi:hypothetical protein
MYPFSATSVVHRGSQIMYVGEFTTQLQRLDRIIPQNEHRLQEITLNHEDLVTY